MGCFGRFQNRAMVPERSLHVSCPKLRAYRSQFPVHSFGFEFWVCRFQSFVSGLAVLMTGNEHPQNHEKSEQLTKDPRTAKANQLETGILGHRRKPTGNERSLNSGITRKVVFRYSQSTFPHPSSIASGLVHKCPLPTLRA